LAGITFWPRRSAIEWPKVTAKNITETTLTAASFQSTIHSTRYPNQGPRYLRNSKFQICERSIMNNLLLKLFINLQNLRKSEQGQDLVEYALLCSLIALAMISGIKSIATSVNTVFTNVSNSLA
jgi:pilus assembly protein Flp/PilA